MEQAISNSAEYQLNKIVDFVIENIPVYKGREKAVKAVIERHIEYKTFDVLFNKWGNPIACVRWNISKDAKTCYVLDLVIDAGYKKKGLRIMKLFISRNWLYSPWVQYIEFQRLMKYPDRTKRRYSIKELLKQRS